MKIVVVGGGIAGLSAAWQLCTSLQAQVSVIDPGPLGGKIRTTSFAGVEVDEGPDAFITRSGSAVGLCRELGIDSQLVAPKAGRTLVFERGRLRALPPGLVLGVPTRLGSLMRSGYLPPWGVARAALDLVMPPLRHEGDLSVEEVVRTRMGSQVATRLVEPLLGSIHAASLEDLSASVTAPQLLAAARSKGLIKGLRSTPGPEATGANPLFLAPKGGMASMVSALVEQLVGRGVSFVAGRVSRLRAAGAELAISGEDLDEMAFDAAVLAVDAPQASRMLGDLGPAYLASVRLASVAVVTLAVDHTDVFAPTDVNGVLVPPGKGLVSAVSFGTHKWPQWSPGAGLEVLRVSVGRHGDPRFEQLEDDQLVEVVLEELSAMAGHSLRPHLWRVSRWPGSFPLYRVGHGRAVSEAHAALLRRLPQVALCGSSYEGAGIPACISSGRSAAKRLAERLRS